MTINLKSRHLWQWVEDNSADPGEPDDPMRTWRVTAKLMLEDSRKMEEIHQADLIRDMELTGRLEEANARIAELEAELERVAQGAADVAWERLKLERQLAEAQRWVPVEDGFVYTFDTGMGYEQYVAAFDNGDDQAHLSVGRTNITSALCYLPDTLRLCELVDAGATVQIPDDVREAAMRASAWLVDMLNDSPGDDGFDDLRADVIRWRAWLNNSVPASQDEGQGATTKQWSDDEYPWINASMNANTQLGMAARIISRWGKDWHKEGRDQATYTSAHNDIMDLADTITKLLAGKATATDQGKAVGAQEEQP